MLRIWGRTNSSNVQKVMWAVGELGLAHERIDIGGAFGRLDSPEYTALNPNRLIPTIEDDGAVIWESNAIVRYLAARYGAGGLWAEDPAVRSAADRWMDWQLTTVQPGLQPVFWGLIRTAPDKRDMAAIRAGAERLSQAMTILDRHLADRAFIAGDTLTIGDIPVGVAAWRFFSLDIARPDLPHLATWYRRLQAREPYRAHVMLPLT